MNIHIVSTDFKSGKSSLMIPLIHFMSNRQVDIAPFKAVSITDDIVDISDGKKIPWSIYQQTKTANIPYQPIMNPILLVPRDTNFTQDTLDANRLYDLYVYGENKRKICGEDFVLNISFYNKIVYESFYQLNQEHNIFSEGMGNAFISDKLFEFANWSYLNIHETYLVLVVNMQGNDVLKHLEYALEYCFNNNINIIGVIVTKIFEGVSVEDDILSLLNRYGNHLSAAVPFNSTAVGNIEDYTDWNTFVLSNTKEEFLNILTKI